MRGQRNHNTQLHVRLPPSFLGMHTWMTSQLNVAFDLQATWVIDVLGLFFWHVMYGYLYNQALADDWSTGAGIKFVYCRSYAFVHPWIFITFIFLHLEE